METPAQPTKLWTPSQNYLRGQKTDNTLADTKSKAPNPSTPLKLIDLIGVALENNPTTRQAWQRAISAKAQVGQARSAWYPTVTVGQDFEAQRSVSNRSALATDYNSGTIGMNLQMTYLLADFGGRSAKIELAFQNMLATNFQFNQTFQDLLLNVASAYFEFYSTTALLEAANMDVKDAKAALDATNDKFAAGVQAKLDVLQAKAQYEKMVYQLEAAKGNVKTAEGQLAKAVGFPAGTPFNIMLPQQSVEFKVGEKAVGLLIEEGLAKRPDIAAQRASLAAKQAAIKAAKSGLWPTLNATGSGANNWNKYFGRHGLTYDNEHDYGYAAGASVNWPVFEGFNTVSKIKAAEADAKAEFESLRDTELTVTADVWDKYYSFVTATRKLTASKAYLDASKGSYDLSMESYKSGLKSFLDLLDAEANLSDSRSQVIKSRRDLYTAFADLVHATGTINERTDASRAEIGTIEL